MLIYISKKSSLKYKISNKSDIILESYLKSLIM